MRGWRTRWAPLRRALGLVLAAVVGLAPLARAAEPPRIRHRPIQYYVPGQRIEVLASVSDESGVEVVRCYFRQRGQPGYLFVDMTPVGGDQYRGVLPAPADEDREIEYAFVILTGSRCVFRTAVFAAAPATERQRQRTPRWQQVPEKGPVQVRAELPAAGGIPGFEDVFDMTAVPPDQQLGHTAGMYDGQPADEEEKDRRPAGAAFGPADLIFCGVIPASAIVAGSLLAPAAAGVGVAAAATGIAVGVADGGGGGGAADFCADLVVDSTTLPDPTNASFTFNLPTPSCGPSEVPEFVYNFQIQFDPGESDGDTLNVLIGGVTVASTGIVSAPGVLVVNAISPSNQMDIQIPVDINGDFTWSINQMDAVCHQCVGT